jgi:hypothetical protein
MESVVPFNRQASLDFFNALFPSLDGEFIEVRLISPTGSVERHFYETPEMLTEAVSKMFKEQRQINVYFGVCPRVGKRGTKADIKRVSCLWVDLDAKDVPGGKTAALKRLREFPFVPTVIADSGHGYHAYWRLKEQEDIVGPGDIARVEMLLKGLANALGGDLQAAEIARILRVPGTYNLKDPSAPALVEIVHYEPRLMFNPSDFESMIPIGPLPASDKSNPLGWIAQALAELCEGNRNGTFAKMAGRLHHDGWSPNDILSLLEPHAERCRFPLDELGREIDGICHRYPRGNSSPSLPYMCNETETESHPLRAVPLVDFLAKSDAPIAWVVEQVIPKNGVAILSAPGGYGKSWMLLDLALELDRGGKWLGHFRTTQSRVLYIDEESSEELLRHRTRKLLASKELTDDGSDVRVVVGGGASFQDRASVARLRELLRDERPGLVVVDSLIRVHRAEENSASEMAGVFQNIKNLVREFGCAFVFADHQRKPGIFGGSLDLALRGSSEKVAFVDSLLSLHRKKGELIVEHSKSRYAQPVTSFVLRIEDINPDATRVKYVGEADEIEQASRLEDARDFLEVDLASDDWVPRLTLVDRAKGASVSEKTLDETLKTLSKEGLIEREDRKPETGRGGKSAYYRWKPKTTPSLSLLPRTETESESERT